MGLRAATQGCAADGRRTVRLDLHRDLRVEQVRDAGGQELFHFRSGDEVVVLLPQAPNGTAMVGGLWSVETGVTAARSAAELQAEL